MLNNRDMLDQYLREAKQDDRLIYEKDMPLNTVSTFKIGGPAAYGIYPNSKDELVSLCVLCSSISVPFIVVGNVSNLVFSDSGYEGAVIFTSGISEIKTEGTLVTVDCGVMLSRLCLLAAEEGMSGIEFAYGIPGTVGGAVYMNAGAYGGELKDVVKSVTYYDSELDEFFTISNDQCGFGYRKSIFQDKSKIILSVTLKLESSDKEAITSKMQEYLNLRKEKQPLNFPSAGSVFKRPEGHFAGKLIEDSALKGFTVGGAQVSTKHAGFIINVGEATCENVKALITHIRSTVKDNFGVELECEIRFVDDPSEVKA